MQTDLSPTFHHQIVTQHLGPDERLHWSGRPHPGIRFRSQDAFLIPFSLIWCAGTVFWETSVIQRGYPLFFVLWGIPFILVGLYLVFGRFFVDALNRQRTYYGITSERVVIVSGLFTRQIKSLQLRTLTGVSLTERSDRSGTITFGAEQSKNPFFPTGGWPGTARYAPPAFEFIGDAKDVYDVLRQAQRAAPTEY